MEDIVFLQRALWNLRQVKIIFVNNFCPLRHLNSQKNFTLKISHAR